jgi:hypothetical protein
MSQWKPYAGMSKYEKDRDTHWTRNRDTILHYLDGGQVLLKVTYVNLLGQKNAVRWQYPTDEESMNFFHEYEAKIAGWKRK